MPRLYPRNWLSFCHKTLNSQRRRNEMPQHTVREKKQFLTTATRRPASADRTARRHVHPIGVGSLRSGTGIKETELPPANILIPLERQCATALPLTVFGRPFVKRFALCYRSVVCPVCLSVLPVTFVHCCQTLGRIKMKLSMQISLEHCTGVRRYCMVCSTSSYVLVFCAFYFEKV